MHLTKNQDGTFTVNDEPLQLDGAAGDQFLDRMEKTDTSQARKEYLEKCDRVYQKTQEKLSK